MMKSLACSIYGLPAARRLPELATGFLRPRNGEPRQSLAKVFWDIPQPGSPTTCKRPTESAAEWWRDLRA